MPIQKVLSEGRVPVKIWSMDVEAEAMQQLINTASLPFVFKHVAAMPDVHFGMGATVGSVIATKGAISPAAVGVDIGCGMMAVKVDVELGRLQDNIKGIRHSIERSVPVGFNANKQLTKTVEEWGRWQDFPNVPKTEIQRAMSQMGSLGGGNHFIEVCQDTEGGAWVVLHSGSRNIGKVVADHHIKNAKAIMQRFFIQLVDPDLAYLAEGTESFDAYLNDVHWCQEYAFRNRQEMMARILKDISHAIYGEDGKVTRLMEVNCHHNYIAKENHYGQNVLVTRKGAVRARQGDLGIIPGSMGSRSYIVEGLGNEESFCSCSHGAGRRMSRNKARATFTLEDLAKQTEGVECRKDEGVLDEIPGAYKDIDVVMENQKDLVKVVAQLKQFMCIKG